MIDSVPLIQNPNDVQQINASIIAMKKASRELDEKIAQFNKLLSQEITNREKAITEAINSLDVPGVGGSGKYISAISETDGKISATESEITSTVSSGNSQPVTSGGVASELEKYPTFISTTMTDANQCVLNDSTLNRVYFYAGYFTTNVPRNSWAIVRCYQYGGGIVQFIDYTLQAITETYRRYIRYDGQSPSAWQKIIRSSDLNITNLFSGSLYTSGNVPLSEVASHFRFLMIRAVAGSMIKTFIFPVYPQVREDINFVGAIQDGQQTQQQMLTYIAQMAVRLSADYSTLDIIINAYNNTNFKCAIIEINGLFRI